MRPAPPAASATREKPLYSRGRLQIAPRVAKSDDGRFILEMGVAVLTTLKKSIGTNNGSSSNAEGCVRTTTVGLRRRDLGESFATGEDGCLGCERTLVGCSLLGGLTFLNTKEVSPRLKGRRRAESGLVSDPPWSIFVLCDGKSRRHQQTQMNPPTT